MFSRTPSTLPKYFINIHMNAVVDFKGVVDEQYRGLFTTTLFEDLAGYMENHINVFEQQCMDNTQFCVLMISPSIRCVGHTEI